MCNIKRWLLLHYYCVNCSILVLNEHEIVNWWPTFLPQNIPLLRRKRCWWYNYTWWVVCHLFFVKYLQCLILWCCSNPWFYSTKRFYVNIIFSLNSAASDFLSESIKFEDWFYFTAKRNVVAAGGFILACYEMLLEPNVGVEAVLTTLLALFSQGN